MMELTYRFSFDAAHKFSHYPAGHPNAGLHGHSFQAEVSVAGEPDRTTGFVVDFSKLESVCAGLRQQLDHRVLNDVEGLSSPSLEHLCMWLWKQLVPEFPSLARVTVRRESAGQSCSYSG